LQTCAQLGHFLMSTGHKDGTGLRDNREFETMPRVRTPATTAILAAPVSARLRRGTFGRAELESGAPGDEHEVVVCFADLVGFTALGGELAAKGLAMLAGRLAELAAEVAREPVRLVKTVGDAAMFMSPDAPPLVEAALSLIEAVDDEELPALRSGIASGTALPWAGDFYGTAVNLASHVTGVAQAGNVLCTKDVRDAAAEGFAWSYAGRHRLKGVAALMPLYRVRRLKRRPAPTRTPAGRGGLNLQPWG
jgi:adenylate cyclase